MHTHLWSLLHDTHKLFGMIVPLSAQSQNQNATLQCIILGARNQN